MMKKIFFAAVLFLLMTSCKKTGYECPYSESSFTAPADEIATLQTYVDNEVPDDAVQHPSGIFYVITNPGDNTIKPNVCSGVVVKYTGYFLPGNTVFENPPDPIGFTLGRLILGWQKGIPLIGKGGSIILYIPPSLAYGAGGTTGIPPNSYLKFEIQLLDVF